MAKANTGLVIGLAVVVAQPGLTRRIGTTMSRLVVSSEDAGPPAV